MPAPTHRGVHTVWDQNTCKCTHPHSPFRSLRMKPKRRTQHYQHRGWVCTHKHCSWGDKHCQGLSDYVMSAHAKASMTSALVCRVVCPTCGSDTLTIWAMGHEMPRQTAAGLDSGQNPIIPTKKSQSCSPHPRVKVCRLTQPRASKP